MKKTLVISALMSAMFSANTFADNSGNITFSGSVSAATCTISAADTSKTVKIPDVNLQTLTDRGDQWDKNPLGTFDVSFSKCAANTTIQTSMKSTTGTSTAGSSVVIAGGAAKGIGLVLAASNGNGSYSTLQYGATNSVSSTPDASGNANIKFIIGPLNARAAAVPNAEVATAGAYSNTYSIQFVYS